MQPRKVLPKLGSISQSFLPSLAPNPVAGTKRCKALRSLSHPLDVTVDVTGPDGTAGGGGVGLVRNPHQLWSFSQCPLAHF